ncbi:hypothetical protein BDZ97DRAFT_1655140 [Flammula alnicola]|nr:hypothetical protein BDZ97DRAFT_1655140 [Flammula alnicola]
MTGKNPDVLTAKRQRTDSLDGDLQDEVASPTRSDNFWIFDGNVILQAQETQFRIHRGVISRHSRVFEDMFSVPQPIDEPLIEGCPVIHLTDAPDDWHNLLTLLYDTNFHTVGREPFSMPMIASMLRLGQKYDLERFRNAALGRLKFHVPTELSRCELLFAGEKLGTAITKGYEFDILAIALELGLKSILPVAYYQCLTNYTLESLLYGILRPDGSKVHLSQATLATLLIGRENIINNIFLHTFHFLKGDPKFFPCATCSSRDVCSVARSRHYETLSLNIKLDAALSGDIDRHIRGFCKYCSSSARTHWYSGRERLWKSLPTYFGLPEWENLKDSEM